MSAFVGDLEPVRYADFLAGLDVVAYRLAALEADAAAFVQCEFGVDQIAVVVEEPLDAEPVSVEDFLIGLEREDDVAIGLVAFLLVADHVRDEGRRHEFVVARAAPVVIAVLLDELEGIGRPVLRLRLDDVDMGKEQERLVRAGAVQAGDEVALARRGLEHLHVGIGKARGAQPRRHGVGRPAGVAGRGDRVDLDQLLVDVDSALLAG